MSNLLEVIFDSAQTWFLNSIEEAGFTLEDKQKLTGVCARDREC